MPESSRLAEERERVREVSQSGLTHDLELELDGLLGGFGGSRREDLTVVRRLGMGWVS